MFRVNLYKSLDNTKRQQLLGELNKIERNALYEFFFDEFRNLIATLEKQNNLACIPAKEMLDNLLKFSGEESSQISHDLLFDLLHQSADLIRTINPDNTLKPEFAALSQEYIKKAQTIRKSANENKFYGVMNALAAAIGIAGMIALAIMSILTCATVPVILISCGGILASGVVALPNIFFADSFFKQENKEAVLANKMEALDTIIEKGHKL